MTDNEIMLADASTTLLGGVLQGITSSNAVREQNEANMALAQFAYEKNREQWEAENAYNTPTAQMQRLRAAGLNPNLVYGSGAAQSVSAKSPQYQAPHLERWQGSDFGVTNAIGNAMQAAQGFYQARNLELQREYQLQKNEQARLDTIKQRAETVDYLSTFRRYNREYANEQLRGIQLSNDKQRLDNALQQFEVDMIPLSGQMKQQEYLNLIRVGEKYLNEIAETTARINLLAKQGKYYEAQTEVARTQANLNRVIADLKDSGADSQYVRLLTSVLGVDYDSTTKKWSVVKGGAADKLIEGLKPYLSKGNTGYTYQGLLESFLSPLGPIVGPSVYLYKSIK